LTSNTSNNDPEDTAGGQSETYVVEFEKGVNLSMTDEERRAEIAALSSDPAGYLTREEEEAERLLTLRQIRDRRKARKEENKIGEPHFDLVYDDTDQYCEEVLEPASYNPETKIQKGTTYCCVVPTRYFSGRRLSNNRWERLPISLYGSQGLHLCEKHSPKLTYEQSLQEALVDYNKREDRRDREVAVLKGGVTRFRNLLEVEKAKTLAAQQRAETLAEVVEVLKPLRHTQPNSEMRIRAALRAMYECFADISSTINRDRVPSYQTAEQTTESAMEQLSLMKKDGALHFIYLQRQMVTKRIKFIRRLNKVLGKLDALHEDHVVEAFISSKSQELTEMSDILWEDPSGEIR